jgi:hypothetical protein
MWQLMNTHRWFLTCAAAAAISQLLRSDARAQHAQRPCANQGQSSSEGDEKKRELRAGIEQGWESGCFDRTAWKEKKRSDDRTTANYGDERCKKKKSEGEEQRAAAAASKRDARAQSG